VLLVFVSHSFLDWTTLAPFGPVVGPCRVVIVTLLFVFALLTGVYPSNRMVAAGMTLASHVVIEPPYEFVVFVVVPFWFILVFDLEFARGFFEVGE
jgi:hypothetical protein